MTRKSTIVRRIGLVSVLALMGISTGMAQASDRHRGGYGSGHRHSATCGCSAYRSVGRITIDGHTTVIRSGRGINAQIAKAFRRAGYNAWIHDGCVRVDYGYCKPSVRWRAESYSVRFSWGWDELTVSARQIHRPRYRQSRQVRPIRRSFRSGSCW